MNAQEQKDISNALSLSGRAARENGDAKGGHAMLMASSTLRHQDSATLFEFQGIQAAAMVEALEHMLDRLARRERLYEPQVCLDDAGPAIRERDDLAMDSLVMAGAACSVLRTKIIHSMKLCRGLPVVIELDRWDKSTMMIALDYYLRDRSPEHAPAALYYRRDACGYTVASQYNIDAALTLYKAVTERNWRYKNEVGVLSDTCRV